jgi:hypothetical protein
VDHPYRALVPHKQARVVIAEEERPPSRAIRVRAWSDATTRIDLRSPRPIVERAGWWLLSGLCVASALAAIKICGGWLFAAPTMAAAYFGQRGARAMARQRIVVTPAAVMCRRWMRGAQVFALADVQTVLVVGSDEGAQLALHVGREQHPVAEELGYDEKTLRWIAQRLRRAIEGAR